MIADPVCQRCSGRMTWNGIGPGAEPFCPRNCDPVLPGTRCPRCKSFAIAPFVAVNWFGIPMTDEDSMSCSPCGKVFKKGEAL